MRFRQEQLGHTIAQEISDLIHHKMHDPRIGFASVTNVEVSADLRHAKVFISVMGDAQEQDATMDALFHGSGFLRHELGQRLHIRYVPDLSFKLDQSIAEGSHMLQLIREVCEPDVPVESPTIVSHAAKEE